MISDETLRNYRWGIESGVMLAGVMPRVILELLAEVERLRPELGELAEARDAASAALFEMALDYDIGYLLLAKDLQKYREIHAKIATLVGVKRPWEVEEGVEQLRTAIREIVASGKQFDGPEGPVILLPRAVWIKAAKAVGGEDGRHN